MNEEKGTILVVEDSLTQATYLRRVLERNGFRVIIAGNGREALEKLSHDLPDLVISDIVMPEMDGFTLCASIKSSMLTGHVPVMLLTSLAESQDVLKGLQCGADNFLTKPFDEPYLLNRISHLLGDASPMESDQDSSPQLEFQGERYSIRSDRKQIVHLLLSVYEAAVRRTHELDDAREKLETLNNELEMKVEARTEQLKTEIDERKRAEQELMKYREHLEQMVAARTADLRLANETLSKTEAALRSSEENLRFATVAADIGTWHWDILSGSLTWNDRCKEFFGYPPDFPITYEAFLEAIYEEDRQRVEDAVRIALLEGTDYLAEMRVDRGAGRWVMSKGRTFLGPEGKPVAMHGISMDVTERKRAEEELRKSEEQFRQLAEALPEIVWMAQRNGCIDYMNGRWYHHTGSNEHETQEKGWGWYLHEDDHDRTVERWCHSVETGLPFETEFRIRGAKGDYRWFLGRALPVRLASGEITHWFATFTDIEDQKRAKEAAEAAAQTKTAFMANMSHEIRTPMNGILGMTDLLLDTNLSQLQRQYLDMVKSSAEALLGVINDVLDFSKIEAGKVELEEMEFNLREVVEKAAETVALTAHRKGLELKVVIDPELPHFFISDSWKLRQVLLNLLSNALKFTEEGEVVITVQGMPSERERWLLHFSVTDTGIGIPKEKQGLLFQSFTQLEASTARSYGGTGLGLAISKRLVELMGGRIWVESSQGQGSIFSFQISLQVADHRAAEDIPHFSGLAGLKTLVVDDNEMNRLMLQRSLTSKGLTVEAARLGGEAVEKVFAAADAGAPFNLVLIDLHLPDMDGFHVAERLRERFPVKGLALMIMTSDDIAGGARRARELGTTAYIVKPLRIAELLEALVKSRAYTEEVKGSEEIAEAGTDTQSAPYCTHVLVAEDNPVNLTVTEAILRKSGVRVTAASNGIEAVDAVEHGRFHLILMDVQMPEMDGLEATRLLRAKGADLPIIGLTAHALEGDRERCLAAGMDDYLAKPVTPQALNDKVAYWARQKPLPPADPAQLLGMLGGEEVDFDKVVATFLKHASGQLAEVKSAVEAQDAAKIQTTAHRLKGAVSVVAAEDARCLAEEIEKAAKAGDVPKAGDLYRRLESEMARVIELLQHPRPTE